MIAIGAALNIELFNGLLQAVESRVVGEFARDKANAAGQLVPNFFVPRGSRILLNRFFNNLTEVLVLPVATREANEREARGQKTTIG